MFVVNHIDATQFINLSLSIILFAMSIQVYRRVPVVRGFSIAMTLIAVVSVVFYIVVILTLLDEVTPEIASFLSGIRSAFSYTLMCGICWMWLRLYREHSPHD
jgi:hypothetical protein